MSRRPNYLPGLPLPLKCISLRSQFHASHSVKVKALIKLQEYSRANVKPNNDLLNRYLTLKTVSSHKKRFDSNRAILQAETETQLIFCLKRH